MSACAGTEGAGRASGAGAGPRGDRICARGVRAAGKRDGVLAASRRIEFYGESFGMNVVTIEKIGEFAGKEITVRGWLYNMREAGKLLFPIFRDGTGLLQGVVSQKEQPEAFAALRGLRQESSVIVTGVIRSEPRAPGGFEMGVTRTEVVQAIPDSEPY